MKLLANVPTFDRVSNAPAIDELPRSVVTEAMAEHLNDIRMGLAMTGRGRPEDVPEAKAGDPLLPLIRELITGGDIGPVSGLAIAEQFASKSGMSKAEFNANITQINEAGKARRGIAGGLIGQILTKGVAPIGEAVKDNPALLFAAPFAVAAISGALSGAGAGSAFTGGGSATAGSAAGSAAGTTSAAAGKAVLPKASGLLKNPKLLTKAVSAGGTGGGASGGTGLLSKVTGFLKNPIVGSTIAGLGEGLMASANNKRNYQNQLGLMREGHELTSSNYRGTDPAGGYRQVASPNTGTNARERFGPSRYAAMRFRYDPTQGRIVEEQIEPGAA